MVFPVFIIVVVLSSIGIGIGTLANWDNIVIALKGKKLAILGARQTGKTHMLQFLMSGSIPIKYKGTQGATKTAQRRFKLQDLQLNLTKTVDVPGDDSGYGEWKTIHDESDIVFYLVRADHLIARNPSTEARVIKDLKHISGWLDKRMPRPSFCIIGTHCDLDPAYRTLTDANKGEYQDRFRKLPVMQELIKRGGGSQQAKVILGSMETIKDTESLLYEVFVLVMA